MTFDFADAWCDFPDHSKKHCIYNDCRRPSSSSGHPTSEKRALRPRSPLMATLNRQNLRVDSQQMRQQLSERNFEINHIELQSMPSTSSQEYSRINEDFVNNNAEPQINSTYEFDSINWELWPNSNNPALPRENYSVLQRHRRSSEANRALLQDNIDLHSTQPKKCRRSYNASRMLYGRQFLLLFAFIFSTILFGASAIGYGTTSGDNTIIHADPAILATFHDIQNGKQVELEKMIMDRSTNRLYVGGVNQLYDISPEGLAVREHVNTGPSLDSPLCADSINGCKETLVPTDSYTKALAIYPNLNKLIECTSLFQGRCRSRNLSSLKQNDVRMSRPGIVPNDQSSSTVIFVGSGPKSTSSGSASVLFDDSFSSRESDASSSSKVLYVGSTYVPVSVGPRDALDVPAVASLSLDNGARFFQLASQSISSGTYMKLDYRRMPNFKIDYVGGFEANGFAYFATRQPKHASTGDPPPQISKLVRVCTQDPNFYSYTEAPLECVRGGEEFNLVQDITIGYPGFDLAVSMHIKPTDLVMFGAFTRGDGAERNITTKNSAVCVYSIKHIEEKFFENIRMCYNGATRTNLPWFNSDKACTATRYPDSEIMCGKDVNSYIGGGISIKTAASLVSRTAVFTSITFSSVQTATVAFIGTDDGVLHKALIEDQNGGLSRIYKSIQLTPDSQPLLQDMELDEKNGLLYALSHHTLYKVNVRLCSPSTDCHACMDVGDPYCGWCMRPSTCTTQDVCDADAIDPQADWLNYKSGRCPVIDLVEPSEQQITAARPLHISIKNIPPKISDLFCSFQFINQQRVNVTATIRDNGVTCSTPAQSSLRSLSALPFTAAASIIARLSVLKADDSSVIAATNFTFYDCHQLRSCAECAISRFPCDWCTLSAKCVPNAEDVCQGETLVNAVSRLGPSSRRGPEYCPRFEPISGGSDVFVASGRKKRISVKALNLPEQAANFKCQYTVESEENTHEKLAHRKGDRIICEDILFEFTNIGLGNGTAIARFDILWSPITVNAAALTAAVTPAASSATPIVQYKLDNSNNMRIVLYKCEQLATNCGLCLGLDKDRYDCGWCDEDQRCAHPEDCPRDSGWLKVIPGGGGMPICPNPRIDDFYPKKGPINGGTKITITGMNLGLTYADVRDAVRVASAKCDINEQEYVSSQRIVCYTRAPSTRQRQGQHVVFKLRDDRRYTAASASTFTYANPSISSFQPFYGPKNGGTDVTILGTDLDSGYMFNVTIGNVPCQLQLRTSTMVVCRTGRSPHERSEYLTLNADGTNIRVENIQFDYRKNPIVDRTQRAVSIISGGIAIDVYGQGLTLLQRPRLVIFFEGELYYGANCEIIDDTMMVCRTPSLSAAFSSNRRRPNNPPLYVDYGFDLDGTMTGNLTMDGLFPKMKLHEDPIIHHFSNLQIIRPGGDLVVKGISLNDAANQRDIRVTVDGVACNVTALASSTLTCLLASDLSDDLLNVVVYVGGKVEKVGVVSQKPPNDASKILIAALITASLAVGLALLLIILYRRKSNSHNRQLRYLKNQMNTIEMKVAQECKEAFHELQTNINALAGSVPQGCSFIPLHSYANYTARILLPNAHPNHPALNDLHVEEDRAHQVETGLRQLHSLLQNRTFLLLFVRTIDENKYLLLKDRVYVGSLLMIILQNRMEYCTDVLKQLLKELIRRNVESKFQPKILFRRAESVAERMLSAWFSFLMYRFLTKGAGAPLYQLYWATKQQTEKGPQDALTMDARYSLSEEKLLRATFDFHELTIFVVCDGICQPGTAAAYETPVRVLDCDSISQVKERCLDAKYRTIPFSERPAPGDVDLELRTPRHRLLLQDLDVTSKCENGVWRYNTLAHYKVENKATLALLCKSNTTNTTNTSSSYNLSMISDRSDRSNSFPFSHLNGGSGFASGSPTLFSSSRANGHTVMANAMVAFDGNTTGSLRSGKDNQHPPSGTTLRVYHLVRPAADHGPQDNQGKMVTEIYLTRLLTMKGTLQKFIEDVLEVVFSTSNGVCPMPPCVKYMFDFLDEQAREHGILDPDVVHAWKSNALPLRFWVNLIKNPDFIFDIQKPTKIEGSLNVIAQTLMDACSTQEHHLTKDSPSSKLLFANEIDKYKAWVQRYYADIQQIPPIGEHEMSMLLAEESREHAASTKFPTFSALNELFVYVSQNKEMIFDELNQNEFALQEQLPDKFQKLLDTLEAAPEPLLLSGPPNGGSTLDNYNSKSRLMANSRFY